MGIQRRNSCIQTHICFFNALILSRQGSKNRICTGADRWMDFFQQNSMPLLRATKSPHRFSRWQKGLPLRCGRFSERPQRMLRRMPSSLSSSVSGIQLNCKCPGTRRLKNVKAKYHQHVSHKQVVGKRYLGAYKKKMLGSIQKKARDLVIEKKKKIIIV